MVQLDERKRAVLSAVVEEYTRSAEPVGSEHPVVRDRLRVSPATIRSAMASLEEMGLLTHPHTSAGRVPTDRGYRLYVDMTSDVEPLSSPDRQAIRRRLDDVGAEPTGAAGQAARVLASVTHYPSVVASPGLQHQTFRSLHLVLVGTRRALAVIATNAGTLQGRMIELPEGVEPDDLERLSQAITRRLEGTRVADLTHHRLEQEIGDASWHALLVEELKTWLRREGSRGAAGSIHIEGAMHLLREPEFRRPELATQVFELLEEASALADVLAEAPRDGVWISIGTENRREELQSCSLVMAAFTYGDQTPGTVGIVGPTRMRYRQAVGAVRYVAERLSQTLRALE
jgi:heat-inducible transcriptional repressor